MVLFPEGNDSFDSREKRPYVPNMEAFLNKALQSRPNQRVKLDEREREERERERKRVYLLSLFLPKLAGLVANFLP